MRACVSVYDRVPEAATWSSRGRLSQSPIDHGIQPVHDPVTLDCKAARGMNRDERDETVEKKRLQVFFSFLFFFLTVLIVRFRLG